MLAENDWPKAMEGTWGYGILGLPRLSPTSDMNWAEREWLAQGHSEDFHV